ncbi:MAG: HAMP domain-containing histidine kinase [Sphingomonadales bacterium]|nr:HAMP domain-containing histidine kinase [Sphingomonadales bacterium]
MTPSADALAHAETDGDDRLLRADEPLAGLQLRCGGTLPGAIAIPALAALVVRARRLGLRFARAIAAQDGAEAIRAWVEIGPRADGEPGCAIAVRQWHGTPLAAEDGATGHDRRFEIDRALAELTARLDARQHLLAVESASPELAPLLAAMRGGLGRPWTDFLHIRGEHHRLPMHWRLLDGASVGIDGSPRQWTARLLPLPRPHATPAGFELFLCAQTPQEPALPSVPGAERLFGRELASALGGPIARIIARAETIRARLAGPLDEDYVRYAADIAAAGEHLMSLVTDLADLEVIEAAGFTTVAETIDLGDLARRAAGILGGRARARAITLLVPPDSVQCPAHAEFRRVLQVLLNLVGNAIQYAPDHSTITLSLARQGERACVTVADEGPGLSAEQQVKLFTKFERLGRAGDGGSGLGLYISRRLAQAMGGDISVASTPGEGARFTLEIPAAA